MTFHIMLVHNNFSWVGLLSCHLSGKSFPLGWPNVLLMFGLLVNLVFPVLVLRAGFGF